MGDPLANVTENENSLCREIAAESSVLLKNDDGLLPLMKGSLKAPSGDLGLST